MMKDMNKSMCPLLLNDVERLAHTILFATAFPDQETIIGTKSSLSIKVPLQVNAFGCVASLYKILTYYQRCLHHVITRCGSY